MKRYIIFLRVISSLSVVILHTNGIFWHFSYDRYWLSANIIESVLYFAVPVFFMISGATLIDYRNRYTTIKYFKKKFENVYIAFFVWSVVSLIYLVINGDITIGQLTYKSIVNDIFNANYNTYYWYFISLIPIYFCIPFFGYIPTDKRKLFFKYYIICAFLFSSLLPFINSITGLVLPFKFNLGGDYLLYIAIGYYIENYFIEKKYRILIYSMGVVGLLITILGTWIHSYSLGNVSTIFKGYLNVTTVLYSVAVFLFFKNMDQILINSK